MASSSSSKPEGCGKTRATIDPTVGALRNSTREPPLARLLQPSLPRNSCFSRPQRSMSSLWALDRPCRAPYPWQEHEHFLHCATWDLALGSLKALKARVMPPCASLWPCSRFPCRAHSLLGERRARVLEGIEGQGLVVLASLWPRNQILCRAQPASR